MAAEQQKRAAPAGAAAYADALGALFARDRGGARLGLSTMQALLAALGHPERRLPAVVGVAGTNGKGSTAAMLAQCLGRAGQRVGLYTSPHLLRFAERIRVDGVALGEAAIAASYARVVSAEARLPRPASFFECATAMAVCAFADAEVDCAVLEVGLGGRLDATNAVPRTLAVFTPIALDHERLLGSTVARIAAEKADIVAPGRPAISAPQPAAAAAVLAETARQRGATLTVAPPLAPLPRGQPAYQAVNLGVAACAAAQLGVGARAIAEAAAGFAWPGRYQWLPGAPPVVLDGAHNPAAVAALLAALAADPRARGRPVQAVFSALVDKRAAEMLAALRAAGASPVLCPLPGARGRDGAALRALDPAAAILPDTAAALAAARAAAGPRGLVLVTGSLHLVGAAMAALLGLPRDPPVSG